MARYLRMALLLLPLLFGAFECSSDEPTLLDPDPGIDSDNPSLALEVYRCGTDFNDVMTYFDIPTVVGNGGIVLSKLTPDARCTPVAIGVANDLIGVNAGYGTFKIVGEGLLPSDPGIIMNYTDENRVWSFTDHPATGHFTGFGGSVYVTSVGEVIGQDDQGSLIKIFEEPGGNRLNGLTGSQNELLVVGEAGVMWIGSRSPSAGSWVGADWANTSIIGGPDFNDAATVHHSDTHEYDFYVVGGSEVWVQRGDGPWPRQVHGLPGEFFDVTKVGTGESNSVIAVGTNGLIATCNDGSWTHETIGADVNLRGVWSWTDDHACGDNGALYQTDQGAWTDLGYSNISPWNDIDAVSSSEVYAANGDTLMTWDGDKWGPFATNFNEITSLHAVSSDRIWVTSRSANGWDNFVQVWTGNMFNHSHHSSMDTLNSVWCDGLGDTVMVAATNGQVFTLGGAGGWEWLTADPARKDFYDLDGTSAHDVFAVGQDGMIAHFNGASWKLMDSGVSYTLRAISGPVAVGDNGAITRWDGSQWKAESAGTTAHLNAVCVIGGKEAWAVGDGGVIISNDGDGDWVVYERSLYTIDLNTVWGANSGDIWFGGDEGYLLRLIP